MYNCTLRVNLLFLSSNLKSIVNLKRYVTELDFRFLIILCAQNIHILLLFSDSLFFFVSFLYKNQLIILLILHLDYHFRYLLQYGIVAICLKDQLINKQLVIYVCLNICENDLKIVFIINEFPHHSLSQGQINPKKARKHPTKISRNHLCRKKVKKDQMKILKTQPLKRTYKCNVLNKNFLLPSPLFHRRKNYMK